MWRALWGASPTSGHPGACPAITPSKVTALCRHTDRQAPTHAHAHTTADVQPQLTAQRVVLLCVCMSADMRQGVIAHTPLAVAQLSSLQ